ncbi:hypothetical protein [Hyphomicrobium sp. 99]|uniref:hypothetical protein n=1 Tax=Hyphomicrobium sp. 99 TaxID=1163419 RepID=UPI0012E02F2D|nr:hypothetical protein [Hyphomicrobium sp. 99]
MLRRHSAFLALLALVLTASAAYAVDTKKANPANAATPGKAAPPAAAPQKTPEKSPTATALPIPDGPGLNILIRRTILTINDANLSGNYSVLRDLASPAFQAANSQATLVGIFADLRNRKIDLAPILMFDPKLVRQPEINPDGMLHLSGFLPTRPEQVNFDLLYENVAGHWRMFGIALNTSRAEPPPTSGMPDTAQR